MSKLTLDDIVSGYNSNTTHNTNNTLIENAIENTLSRDGTGPNAMSAPIDMNSNRVLNLPEPVNVNEPARLQDVQNAIAGNTAANLITSDDGSSGTLWTTVQGFINKITSSVGSSVIGFVQAEAGAVHRTVESKLRDKVSVADYGAVGDAITAAGTNEIVQVSGTPSYTSTTDWNGRQHQTDEAPFLLESITWTGAALNARMCVSNGLLFVCEYVNSKIAVFQLSNARKPLFLTSFTVGTNPRHVEALGSYLFVACHGAASIEVYDIQNLYAATLVGTIVTGANPKMFQIVGGEIIVACYGTSKIEKHRFALPYSGTTGFTSTKLGELALTVGPLCLAYNGAGIIAIVGLITGNIDLVGYRNLNLISSTTIGSANHGCCVWATETNLLVTDSVNNMLYSIDCSSLTAVQTAAVATSSAPEQIEIVGNRCYVPSLTGSGVSAYLDCFDITNATTPVKFKSVPLTVTGAGFTAYHDGYVYVDGHFAPWNIDVVEVLVGTSKRLRLDVVEKLAVQDLHVANLFVGGFGGIQANAWTPVLSDSAGTPNQFTLSYAIGTYFKIGNLVFATAECVWTSIGSVGATALQISNLPFATQNVVASRYAAALGNLSGMDTAAGGVQIVAGAVENSTAITFKQVNDNAASTPVLANSCSATGELSLSIIYVSNS